MYFDGAFRHIGTIDPQPWVDLLQPQGEEIWSEYVRRQERFRPHRQTLTIPLLYDEDMRHCEPSAWPRLAQMEHLLLPVQDLIRQANAAVPGEARDGYFVRAILTRLIAGGMIRPHRDYGESLTRSHRYHYVIKTNEQVQFGVGSELRHLAAGEVWEINNRLLHGVQNLGDEDRVHLIIDYVVPGEEILDPQEGLLVA